MKHLVSNFAFRILGVGLAYVLAIMSLLPIAWLVVSSFRHESDILGSPYKFSGGLTLGNYITLWHLPEFTHSLRNSFLIASMTVIFTALVSIPAGYLLARFRFRGREVLRMLSVLGYLFAPAVLALPYFQLLSKLALVNSIFGIVFAHVSFCLPFSLALADLTIRAVPLSIEEVAMLDGSSLFRRLFGVVIPAARYQFAALLLLVFTISWKEFFFAFLISSGYQTWTLPVLLGSQYGGEAVNWPLLCAVSTVLVLPAITLLLVGRMERVLVTAASVDRG
jgi:multiple sugar transport system permease protein